MPWRCVPRSAVLRPGWGYPQVRPYGLSRVRYIPLRLWPRASASALSRRVSSVAGSKGGSLGIDEGGQGRKAGLVPADAHQGGEVGALLLGGNMSFDRR